METLKAISSRRSIRKYLPKALPKATLETILQAGMDAPSAIDEQPWHFLVIENPTTLKKIPDFHSHSQLVANAPACILVCADKALEKVPDYWVQDCSACSQNILLASHDCGLGAVWIGVYPTTENVIKLKELFKLPENITPFSLIALGYPDEPYPKKQNHNPQRIHFENW